MGHPVGNGFQTTPLLRQTVQNFILGSQVMVNLSYRYWFDRALDIYLVNFASAAVVSAEDTCKKDLTLHVQLVKSLTLDICLIEPLFYGLNRKV